MFNGSGPVTLRASQAGDDFFNAAPDVDQTFDILTALDSWLMVNFNAEEILDLAISGTDADPDLDGLSNGIEFALDLDPRKYSNLFTEENTIVINEFGDFTLRFNRNLDAVNAIITIEESEDLTAWTAIATSTNGAPFEKLREDVNLEEGGEAGGSVYTVALMTPPTSPANFKRIRVVR
jgi:hypothetical protein